MKSWPLIGRPIEQDTTIKHMMETTRHRPPCGTLWSGSSQEDPGPRQTGLFDSLCSVNTSRSKAPDETAGQCRCRCRGRDEERPRQTVRSSSFKVLQRPNTIRHSGRTKSRSKDSKRCSLLRSRRTKQPFHPTEH